MKSKTNLFENIPALLFVVGLLCFTAASVIATTPNPGHPWSEVGDGTFSITGPTVMRTYTLPDSNATLLTDAATVTPAQGGAGQSTLAQGDILYASGTNTLSKLAKDANSTRFLSNTGVGNNPAWAQVDLATGVTGVLPLASGGTGFAYTQFTGPTTSTKTFTLPNATSTILTSNTPVTLAQGGTSKSLTASNGGILYTDTDSVEVLAGAATAGQILQSGASSAPTWSTATYPQAAGNSGGILTSDGTNFSPTETAVTGASIPSYYGSGQSAFTASSTTVFKGGIFYNPTPVTVNQISYTVNTLDTGGTIRMCIYNESGTTKLIDVSNTAVLNRNTVTVSPAVVLPTGNYYVFVGCAASCGNVSILNSMSASISMVNGVGVPFGKQVHDGTVTMSSAGTCNTSLSTTTSTTITAGGGNATPRIRFDN